MSPVSFLPDGIPGQKYNLTFIHGSQALMSALHEKGLPRQHLQDAIPVMLCLLCTIRLVHSMLSMHNLLEVHLMCKVAFGAKA